MNFLEAYKNRLERLRKLRKLREEKQRIRKLHKKSFLEKHMQKAGMYINKYKLFGRLFNVCLIINLLISAFLIYFFSTHYGYPVAYVIILTLFLWLVAFFGILLIVYLMFYLFLDFKIFRRRMDIEDVLPDFLQLTSANIRAGMPIDKALWFAVRPRFGVLAKEIEMVAKETMSGEELNDSLQRFADKYNSDLVKRSINLMIEGLEGGGEVGDLLDKISSDIQEARIMRKEMTADVMAYVIFITFASIVAAPLLMALSLNLLQIITTIMGKVAVQGGASAGANIPIQISRVSVNPSDFRIFALTTLTMTSFFSSIIVAIIQKGNVKEGMRYIPAFVGFTVVLFLIMAKVFEVLLSGFF
ncbi:type II secretion system F family protein [Candidatus Woesearchaeota archaeon]|nr:type II secretion system F family protein [Candidatus Woesearchaeota archaeon]